MTAARHPKPRAVPSPSYSCPRAAGRYTRTKRPSRECPSTAAISTQRGSVAVRAVSVLWYRMGNIVTSAMNTGNPSALNHINASSTNEMTGTERTSTTAGRRNARHASEKAAAVPNANAATHAAPAPAAARPRVAATDQ